MASLYTEVPANFSEIESFVITDREEIVSEIYKKDKCFFYDTCSFRYHANLTPVNIEHLMAYIQRYNGIVILTRCILMELASLNHTLNAEYIDYIKEMHRYGVKVLLIYEEDIFYVMDVCFSKTAVINDYLTWAVRMIRNPVSTITDTFLNDPGLSTAIIGGKHLGKTDIYHRFFSSVRGNKQQGDNLGEELLAICLHILSNIPGEKDEKFVLITDDKGAAGMIDCLFKKTNAQHQGKHIVIFSTPKLVQYMYIEDILTEREDVEAFLNVGNNGTVKILGTRSFDLHSEEITVSCEELANWIFIPNKIHIDF